MADSERKGLVWSIKKSLLTLTADELFHLAQSVGPVPGKDSSTLKEDADIDESQVNPTPTDDKERSSEQQTPETSAHTPKKKRKSALADLLGQMLKTTHHRLLSTSITETEVKQYLDAPPLPLTDDLFHWWKSHAQAYPLLAKLAQRHLCVPGTSVPVERVFSTAGDIISSQRSCSTSEHADQLLFLKKNMQF